ncbi:diguanylate cyclase [Azospirillum sp. TSO22-1]|uniref:diguanylate cyclase n=1 Tax=Azospirillum sp. TSO22-1 TaxID=716789 RepID=UPI000D61670E|nr:diguanylate cyclase [Azospirillum sp. TSO22-1]PWC53591.1 hypothetical protein TSO221_10160 [Azospirillum sp. TSO22-1]
MDYRLSDLIDLQQIKRLMEAFHALTGLPSTLIDPQGNVLTTADGAIVGVGWKRICLDFHRVAPATAEACRLSDVTLSRAMRSRTPEACSYTCLNGLVDAAVPVVIDGVHIVNLFTGQFLLAPPDESLFREQAARFGFDEDDYLDALREVPVFTREYMEKGLAFLACLAATVAEMGLRQKRLLEVNAEVEGRVQVRTAELSAANALLQERLAEIERLKKEVEEQAVRDPLTGLYNRRYFDEVLKQEVARAQRTGRPLAMVMLDIDRFKQVNDTFGHQAGDAVLKMLAAMLLRDTRAHDVVCRYGGEEFAVLMSDTQAATAAARAECWRTAFAALPPLVKDGREVQVTVSAGFAILPASLGQGDELVRRADLAMYRAKQDGRDRVQAWNAALDGVLSTV